MICDYCRSLSTIWIPLPTPSPVPWYLSPITCLPIPALYTLPSYTRLSRSFTPSVITPLTPLFPPLPIPHYLLPSMSYPLYSLPVKHEPLIHSCTLTNTTRCSKIRLL